MARVGVPEGERAAPQRLLASITFGVSAKIDEISSTVDYAAVAEETQRFVATFTCKLIETLAERIAAHLFEKFPISEVRIELRKFVLPDADHVSVTVERRRTDGP